MDKYLIVIPSLFLCVITFAQTGTITGMIKDSATQDILVGANVQVKETGSGIHSDAQGKFYMNLLPGNYTVEVSFIGFETMDHKVEIKSGETFSLDIELNPGNIQLDDVTVTGDLTQQVNTISQVDIKLRTTNTSQDILRMIPGLFIAQHAGGGKAEQIFLRGFDIDHGTDINLDVDGLPVNMVSHAHGQGYSDLHFLIPEIVQYVDFNKGPYYASKGDFTTAGYASLQTKNKLERNLVKLEGGRFGTVRNVMGLNILDKDGQTLYLATELFHSDGYFESPQNFNRFNAIAKYNYRSNEGDRLTMSLSTFKSRWDASGQIPERAVRSGMITRFGSIDNTEGGETSRTQAYVKYINNISEKSSLENQAYWINYDFLLFSNFTFFLNDPVNGDQIRQRENRNIYGYRGCYFYDGTLFGGSLQTEAGAGVRFDDVNDIRLSHTRSQKIFLEDIAFGDVDELNLNGYVSETLTVQKFSINAALRFDHFRFGYNDKLGNDNLPVNKSIVSPKLNLMYNASSTTSFFIRAGTGFHSNDARVVTAQKGRNILPRAYGVDVGATVKVTPRLLMNTAFWMLDLDQEFVYVGDEGIVEPGSRTRRTGIDVSVRYQFNHWLFADTDVSVTRPRDKENTEGKNLIPLAPTTSSIGGLTFKCENGMSESLRYRYLEDRAANEDNSVLAEGYFLLDAVVKYNWRKFEFSIAAENLLNDNWKEAQFDTESQLADEPEPVSEIHFTPGTPFFVKAGVSFYF